METTVPRCSSGVATKSRARCQRQQVFRQGWTGDEIIEGERKRARSTSEVDERTTGVVHSRSGRSKEQDALSPAWRRPRRTGCRRSRTSRRTASSRAGTPAATATALGASAGTSITPCHIIPRHAMPCHATNFASFRDVPYPDRGRMIAVFAPAGKKYLGNCGV